MNLCRYLATGLAFAASFCVGFAALGQGAAPGVGPGWQQFRDASGAVYEPSGLAAMPDGRVLVVQDEARNALGVLQFVTPQGAPEYGELAVAQPHVPFWKFWASAPDGPGKLEDLEAMAPGGDGAYFAVTSHSRARDAARHMSREKLLRIGAPRGDEAHIEVFGGLVQAMIAAYPELAGAAASDNAKGREGLNIEALARVPGTGALLIGLRGPVIGQSSLILKLENPDQVFKGAPPRFAADPIRLDMAKQGIRAMAYVEELGQFLIIGQKAKKTGSSNRDFHLWAWRGVGGAAPRQIDLVGIDLRNAEGITPIRLNGQNMLLFVSDDGTRRKGWAAHYLLLPVEVLREKITW